MQLPRWLVGMAVVVGVAAVMMSARGRATSCPGIATEQCRSTAPNGALLHNPNSGGRVIWTTRCEPNGIKQHLDSLCDQISHCAAAGGFGFFLRAVTNDCQDKSFGNVFGLDGLTFGILDWTEDNLPAVFSAYKARDPAGFEQHFGSLNIPMRGNCVDSNWACSENRQGRLMCEGTQQSAFSTHLKAALSTPDFRRAQTERAMAAYADRLILYASLGFTTDYGRIAMSVVANNLKRGNACRPATWKAQCAGKATERELVDCMLDRYVDNECRGSREQSASRRDAIRAAFNNPGQSVALHPDIQAVFACAADWAK